MACGYILCRVFSLGYSRFFKDHHLHEDNAEHEKRDHSHHIPTVPKIGLLGDAADKQCGCEFAAVVVYGVGYAGRPYAAGLLSEPHEEHPEKGADNAHSQHSRPRVAGIVRPEIMSLHREDCVPQSPDDAAYDDSSCRSEYRFHLLVHVAPPAKFLTEGVECNERYNAYDLEEYRRCFRRGVEAPQAAKITVAADQSQKRSCKDTGKRDGENGDGIIFQISFQVQVKAGVVPALVGQFPCDHVCKGGTIAHEPEKHGVLVGLEPLMIAQSTVEDEGRYPRKGI